MTTEMNVLKYLQTTCRFTHLLYFEVTSVSYAATPFTLHMPLILMLFIRCETQNTQTRLPHSPQPSQAVENQWLTDQYII